VFADGPVCGGNGAVYGASGFSGMLLLLLSWQQVVRSDGAATQRSMELMGSTKSIPACPRGPEERL
jgi:hypothetical protein